ncbi:TetR/AcrR family transcriptional regulator [Streptomyces boncukensis]|uniref:TetR family transcriptional regulator n=1 Tax=Streptomyces boncukensis TaxID=2711219 RepID=A0A6G4WX31_9ACTN|nr:TetR/AcrR family transcriptional regulator [Streptomyces boncukensis]NGO69668.1 TetR family transcriptional regulator [Streptomyces boncukensis]
MPRQSAALDRATPEAIARAALDLVDEEGPQALNLRALAERLGVSHTTVHRRCGSTLAGLVDLCTDHLAAQLPRVPPGTPWAEGTRIRFTALYELLTRHPGLVALRGARPWLSRELLARLVEPQLAANIAAGMAPDRAVAGYRQMYLFTLGAAGFVEHRDPAGATARTRTALAALDPGEFPVLTGHLDAVLPALTDHEVFTTGLHALIEGARP